MLSLVGILLRLVQLTLHQSLNSRLLRNLSQCLIIVSLSSGVRVLLLLIQVHHGLVLLVLLQ